MNIVPKAGHWIGMFLLFHFLNQLVRLENVWADKMIAGDENPVWVANRVAQFLALDSGIPSIDLSYLKDKVTLLTQP